MQHFISEQEYISLLPRLQAGQAQLVVPRQVARNFFLRTSNHDQTGDRAIGAHLQIDHMDRCHYGTIIVFNRGHLFHHRLWLGSNHYGAITGHFLDDNRRPDR